jgi:hypothetical protein
LFFKQGFDGMHYTRCTPQFISAVLLASAGSHTQAQPINVEELFDRLIRSAGGSQPNAVDSFQLRAQA